MITNKSIMKDRYLVCACNCRNWNAAPPLDRAALITADILNALNFAVVQTYKNVWIIDRATERKQLLRRDGQDILPTERKWE